MKLFLVDAVSSFRNSYVVRAKEASHASDTVVLEEAEGFGQQYLGESITRVQEITEEQYLQMFNEDNDYLMSWSDEQKREFIHEIDYETAYNPISSSVEI